MLALEFTAYGRPRSKGSRVTQRTAGGRLRSAAVQEDDLKHWTSRIRSAATLALKNGEHVLGTAPGYPRSWPGPVLVLARYRLVRPLRLADTLADEPATVVPDGDKLERALWDALTGLAFADDCQVIGWVGLKAYASPLERAGVTCRVLALDELEATEVPPAVILAGELERWTTRGSRT